MKSPHSTSDDLSKFLLFKPFAASPTFSFANMPSKGRKHSFDDDSAGSYTDHDDAASQSSGSDYAKRRRYNRSTTNKANRRAKHNATEKARREDMSTKFQQLAEVLPNLQHSHRPSRGVIVEKALDWVKTRLSLEEEHRHQMQQLMRENKRLHLEIGLLQKPGMISCPSGFDIQQDVAQPFCFDLSTCCWPPQPKISTCSTFSPPIPIEQVPPWVAPRKDDEDDNSMPGDYQTTTSDDSTCVVPSALLNGYYYPSQSQPQISSST